MPCFKVKEKVDPTPYSLRTFRLEFISSSSSFVILIPRPVPSIFRFLFSSMRSKDTNSLSISSGLIPIPVSVTETISWIAESPASFQSTFKITLPSSVYLTAFVSRLIITCFRRISSPNNRYGISSATIALNSRRLLTALISIILMTSVSTFATSYSTGSISILPHSILEKSRRSLTSDRSVVPASRMFSAYPLIGTSVASLKMISSIPSTVLIGVLIS